MPPQFTRNGSLVSELQRQPYKRIERRLATSETPMTDATTSARMGRVRQRDTAPELAVRRVLYALGMRYTTRNRDLPGSPDLANRSRRWAIFVHGCYWHRHEGCARATTPRNNRSFWIAKFARNVERDKRAAGALRSMGYEVLTVWECETENVQELTTKLREFACRFRNCQARTTNGGSKL